MHSNPRNVLTISITYYTQKYSLEHLYDRVKKVLFKTISWIARALRASHTHAKIALSGTSVSHATIRQSRLPR